MRFDHVILAAGDLDRAAEEFEAETGLATLPGGTHEALGTHNRVVPLGGGYVELMAILDPSAARASDMVRSLHERIAEREGKFFAWCLAVDDVEAVAARLGTELTVVRREGLSARVTGLEVALREPALPFFIARDEGIVDPGAGGDAGGIAWVEVSGDAGRLADWLGPADLDVRVREGRPEVLAVGVGDRELRPGGSPG